ncbi:MAG: diguanylate cyclase [Magnetospirillum sp.]|nr:diguanylate cyclase [Magnetospirillum sp.]
MTTHKARILIVDDEPINIRILHKALADDYVILAATSGAEGIAVAERERPSLILLDVVMPEMDGYEVCRRLKANPQTADVPVIFVTAMSNVADEATGLEAGAIDYLTKPISAPIVRLRIRNQLELKHYRDMLVELSFQDGLTGIPNRRRFDTHLATEWKRSARLNGPLSLLLIDIDHFKLYNDHYGHIAGDDCLRRVAQALKASTHRPTDLVARYGGEEFACILPETGADGAEAIAHHMQDAVRTLAIPHARSLVSTQVTISLGLASCVAEGDTGRAEDLIRRADAALYAAKLGGRNRLERE